MVRLLVVLFWLSVIVGTYVTGNVVGNWVVCLLALFFFVRSRRRREPHLAESERAPSTGSVTRQSPAKTVSASSSAPLRPQAPHPVRTPAARRRWR